MREPTYAEISALAYRLYEEDGKPHGESEIHWHRALDLCDIPRPFPRQRALAAFRAGDHRTLDAKAECSIKACRPIRTAAQGVSPAGGIRRRNTQDRDDPQGLKDVDGVTSVENGEERGTVRIAFDARKTNAAAIIDLLTPPNRSCNPPL